MGACSTKAALEPSEARPVVPKSRSPVDSHNADPHSETDNGATAEQDVLPSLSPPVNSLLHSGPASTVAVQSGALFSPSFTGGSSYAAYPASAASSSSQASVRFVSCPAVTFVDVRESVHEHPASLHTEAVQCVLADVEGETVSCSADKTIVSYAWKTKALDRWSTHSKAVEVLASGGRSRTIFSGSRDTTIRQWRAHTFKEIQSFRGHTLPVTGLLYSQSNNRLISGARDYSLREWNVETGQQLSMKTVSQNVVTCLRWLNKRDGSGADSPVAGENDSVFLQGSEDSAAGIRFWDSRSFEVAAVFPSAAGKAIRSIDVDPNNSNFFASVSGASLAGGPNAGGELRLWDRRQASSNIALGEPSDAEPLLTILAHADSIASVVFLPSQQGSFLATASKDKTLKVWDVSSSFDSGSSATRCTQALTYRDRKFAVEFTALAVGRPVTAAFLQSSASLFPSSATAGASVIVYAGSSLGAVSAWHWNGGLPTHAKMHGKLELMAQTKTVAQAAR